MYPLLPLNSGIIRIVSSALGICDYKNDKTYRELIGRIDRSNGFAKKRNYTHPYLQPVDKDYSFKFKKDHWTIMAEILCLEELHKELEQAPPDVVVFHMGRQNDFANWVREVIHDYYLAENLERIQLGEPDQTRAELVKILGHRIRLLKFQ